MTKTEIMSVINETNTNKSIKWSIVENTDTKIVLTNSYDKCVNYSIEVKLDDLDEWIDVNDNHMGYRVCVLIWDEDNWGDYTDTKQGMLQGVAAAVRNFNSMY